MAHHRTAAEWRSRLKKWKAPKRVGLPLSLKPTGAIQAKPKPDPKYVDPDSYLGSMVLALEIDYPTLARRLGFDIFYVRDMAKAKSVSQTTEDEFWYAFYDYVSRQLGVLMGVREELLRKTTKDRRERQERRERVADGR